MKNPVERDCASASVADRALCNAKCSVVSIVTMCPGSAFGGSTCMDLTFERCLTHHVRGTMTQVGDSSLASRSRMGAYSRLITEHGKDDGLTCPGGFETNLVGGFHDIYVGTNGAFTALPRYDLVTGLGSLEIGHQTVDIDLINDGDGQ